MYSCVWDYLFVGDHCCLLTFKNASYMFERGYIVGYIFCTMLPLSKYHYLVSSVQFKDTI